MKHLSHILSILLLAVLLTACKVPASSPVSVETNRPADSTAATLTDPPAGTTAPITTPAPPETAPPAEPVTYPAWEEHSDIELLASLDSRYGDLQQMSGWRDRLLLSFARSDRESGALTDAYAQLLNVTTGELSEAVKLPGGDCRAVFLENGRICLYDPLSCTAAVYDLAGNRHFHYECRDVSLGLDIDPAGSGTLWCYSGDSPVLTKVSLDGSSVKQITVPHAEGGFVLGHRDGVTYYSAWDGENGRIWAIDPDGTVSLLDGAEQYYWGGGCLYTDGDPNWLTDPADMDTVYRVQGEDAFSWIVAGEGSHLLAERFVDEGSSSFLWVLDYANAIRYPPLSIEGERYCHQFCFFEEGVLCFAVGSYGTSGEGLRIEICRWSYCHDGETADLICTARTEADQENAELAARIKEKWGVSVIYTEPLIHRVASDYSTVAITDPLVIQSALNQVYDALSAYPDGFFDDLCYGNYTVLELYLCGKFTPLTDAGITTAEALSNTRGSAMVIGFNVELMDGEYVRVLAHELLHNMERRIDQIDPDALSEWISLTPGGHDAYYYSYHDQDGNEMHELSHTYFYESDPADAYFVDAYSKSFPTEDRARVFEKLMESGGNPYFADSPVLMEKARTLCRIIREYFPSVAAIERASWEVE